MEQQIEIEQITQIVESLIKGNYFKEIKIDEYDTHREMAIALKTLQSQLASQAFEVRVANAQVESVSEKIKEHLLSQAQNNQEIHHQAQSIVEINNYSIETMQETVHQTTKALEIIEETNEATTELNMVGKQSQEQIKVQSEKILSVLDYINNIQSSIDESDQIIKQLGIVSQKITKIVDTVQSFSKQTHLVAMNASIEAARSGQAGQGFAVIADEIRRLAEESGESVEQIYDLISALMKEIEAVTSCNQSNKETVKQTVEESQVVSQGLESIKKSYGTVLSNISTITERSNESSQVFKEVESALKDTAGNVSEMSEQFVMLEQAIEAQFTKNRRIEAIKERLIQSSQGLALVTEGFNIDGMSECMVAIDERIEQMQKGLKEIVNNTLLTTMLTSSHQACIDKALESHAEMGALWTNDCSGDFVYSNPPSGIDNAKIRSWFNEAIKGKEYVSDIYISAISKKPCITISMPIKKDGEVIGVIGADIDLQQ